MSDTLMDLARIIVSGGNLADNLERWAHDACDHEDGLEVVERLEGESEADFQTRTLDARKNFDADARTRRTQRLTRREGESDADFQVRTLEARRPATQRLTRREGESDADFQKRQLEARRLPVRRVRGDA